MKLSFLLHSLEYKLIQGDLDIEISDLIFDSRKAKDDVLFVSLIGSADDGHRYINSAADKGAVAVLVQKGAEYEADKKLTVVEVENTRIALAYISAQFFNHPSEELFTIGITGTKGKTTTAYMVRNILEACGVKTGLIGTIEILTGDESIASVNTTPESYVIEKALRKMADAGCKAVVMEVSSQGLKMHRTASIMFDCAVFTNIGNDHIGANEHKDFNEYLNCKAMLFKQCKMAIINIDDAHAKDIMAATQCPVKTYGISEQADIRAENIKLERSALKPLTVYDYVADNNVTHVEMRLPGRFSVYNSLCAVAVAGYMKLDNSLVVRALKDISVKGRVETVDVSERFTVMIDYAHNAFALESVLKTMREYNPHRLVVLFGCGGNRAKTRRYSMGEIAGKMADFTIITSDNPRYEKPEEIIEDIKSGINKTAGKYVCIPSRSEAVEYALKNAEDGDIIILCGKGHEDYLEIEGTRYPVSERQLILEAAKRLMIN